MFYSETTKGFYNLEIHSTDSIPEDAIEISVDYYANLMLEQSNGKIISMGEDGFPVANYPVIIKTKESLLSEVAEKRWKAETGGIVVSEKQIATDRESQAQLTSVYTALKNNLIPSTYWKIEDGTFVEMTLSDIEPMAQAVSSHVRACFDNEKKHFDSISILITQEEIDAYDINTGWPVPVLNPLL